MLRGIGRPSHPGEPPPPRCSIKPSRRLVPARALLKDLGHPGQYRFKDSSERIGRRTLAGFRLESEAALDDDRSMSSVPEIESALARLSIDDLHAVRDWLDDFIEDRMEVSEEFKAKVQRAQEELSTGTYSRTRPPDISS